MTSPDLLPLWRDRRAAAVNAGDVAAFLACVDPDARLGWLGPHLRRTFAGYGPGKVLTGDGSFGPMLTDALIREIADHGLRG